MAGVVPHVKYVQTLEDWEMVASHTVSCGSFVDLVFQFVCKEEAFDKGRIFSLFQCYVHWNFFLNKKSLFRHRVGIVI